MISIITVNWNSYDFLDLLIESLAWYSYIPHELIVVDNSDQPREINKPHVHQFVMPANIGHGRGLNHGVYKSLEMFPRHSFVMFLDVDCHMVSHNWEEPLIKKMKDHHLVGGKGVPSKPIRPACMFMRKELARYDWADTLGYRGHRNTPDGFDVAIKAYYKILADGYSVGFLTSQSGRYGTLNGEEWCVNDRPLVYHHWHGSHLKERQVDFPDADLIADKHLLFGQIPWRTL